MPAWTQIYEDMLSHLRELRDAGCPDPFFRGQSDSNWNLFPSAARYRIDSDVESRISASFQSLGGHLFPSLKTSWDVLYLMQHHGVPTRLLDWTESFAVALYFAVKNCRSECVVWVMNPYEFNKRTTNSASVLDLNTAFPSGYESYFIEDDSDKFGKFPAPAVSVYSSRLSSRMQWQRAVFTLHRDLQTPLESLYPDTIRKFIISSDNLCDAKDFLILSGTNEYSIFPDLDGLARYLKDTEIDSSS